MPEKPPEMYRNGRPPDQTFLPEERLFRRFPPECLDDGSIALDAIRLPDMSVNREKYGPPEWTLLENDAHGSWGVAAFAVSDLPPEMLHLGTWPFTCKPRHVPLDDNYPHTEIWLFDSVGEHISAKAKVDPDWHLRWRRRLRQRIKIIIQPATSAP